MPATRTAVELSNSYRATQLQVRNNALAVVSHAWAGVNPARLDESFASFLPVASTITRTAQATAAGLAPAYLGHYVGAELHAAPKPQPIVPGAFAGRTLDGAALDDVLPVGLASTRLALAQGLDDTGALAAGLARIGRLVASEVYGAGRASLYASMGADESVDRYQRLVSSAACSFCVMLAGRGGVYREATVGFDAHANCACTAEPVVTGANSRRYQRSAPDAEPMDASELDAEQAAEDDDEPADGPLTPAAILAMPLGDTEAFRQSLADGGYLAA